MSEMWMGVLSLINVLPLGFLVWLMVGIDGRLSADTDLSDGAKDLASVLFSVSGWAAIALICVNLVAGVSGVLGGVR